MARGSRPDVLKPSTVRDFGGGWNVIDSELNLSSKYARVLTNLYRAEDSSLQIRWGTRLFADLNTHFGVSYPIGCTYFNTKIVVVSSTGVIVTIDGAGAVTKIFPVTGKNWNASALATFAQFKGDLIICNGVDKPLLIKRDYTIDWLKDIGTNSNLNTPIAQYVIAMARYVVMAGDPAHPDRLHISAKDASGTWSGDPAPNDATYIDLGAYVNTEYTINSLAQFRGKLIVGFNDGVLPGSLGVYSGDIHSPSFDDYIAGVGSLSHPAIQTFGDDVLYLDLVGVPQLSRTLFTQSIRPGRASQLIDPAIQAELQNLTTYGAIKTRVFSVYNQKEGQYMLFIPNNNTPANITATKCFVFTNNPQLDVKAWSLFDGWNFSSGCRSAEGRIFFTSYDNKLYIYGSNQDPIYADFVDDTDVAADGSGTGIVFDWEMPWSDFKTRTNIKKTRFIAFDTKGTATFTVEQYVDNLIKDVSGTRIPQLSMSFVGGDAPAYGGAVNDEEQPYGGARRAVDERLWKWPSKFKIAKLRISGATKRPLRFVAVSVMYQVGSIRR